MGQVIRLLALGGLAVSAWLLVGAAEPHAPGCGHDGGCDAVLGSSWASPLGVPLPIFGLLLFVFLARALGPWGARATRALIILSVTGGVVGLALILVQVIVLRRVCLFCLTVDGIAILQAALAVLGRKVAFTGSEKLVRVAWLAGGALAGVVGAGAAAVYVPPQAPPELRALRQPDRVTVVEILDLRCKHCRTTHKVIDHVHKEFGDRIRRCCFLTAGPGDAESRRVSRTLFCGRRQGCWGPLVQTFFAPGYPAGEEGREMLRSVGLDPRAVEACLEDPAVEAEWEAEHAWLERASPRGLPAVWIDDQLLSGTHGPAEVREAILKAERARQEGRHDASR